jgi:hypothetical protein
VGSYFVEYCILKAENWYWGVLAYAEHDGIGFETVAATSRDTSRDTMCDIDVSRGILHIES